jgi:hypothetical protein
VLYVAGKGKAVTRKSYIGVALALAAAVAILLCLPTVTFAQGCALCYQSAASAGQRAIQALRSGIIILIIPPFFICSAITYLVYRRRNLHEAKPKES